MEPEQFLNRLGLKDTPEDDEWILTKLKDGGYDIYSLNGVADRLVNNALFYDKEIACHILGGNFKRLTASLAEFLFSLKKAPLRNVADLGGGTGILSLYGSTIFPDVKFDVFDQSENPLKLGEIWATKLGIRNVTFNCLSFKEILNQSIDGLYDRVQFEYVLDLANETLPDGNNDYAVGRMYDEPLLSAVHLLKAGGMCVIRCGDFNIENAEALIDSARHVNLSLDPQLTQSNYSGLTMAFIKQAQVTDRRFDDIEILHSCFRRWNES
jgi:hypothetical protein